MLIVFSRKPYVYLSSPIRILRPACDGRLGENIEEWRENYVTSERREKLQTIELQLHVHVLR